MTTYLTDDVVHAWIGDTGVAFDVPLMASTNLAVTAAIDTFCGRTFIADSTATARLFRPTGPCFVEIDDCYEITSVTVDDGDTATYSTTLTTADYVTTPLNGVGPNRRTGWPTTGLQTTTTYTFPTWNRNPAVKVTAKWGWSAVPDDVKQAALLLFAELYNAKNAPLGAAGVAEFGPTLIRGNARIAQLLMSYQRVTAMGSKYMVA